MTSRKRRKKQKKMEEILKNVERMWSWLNKLILSTNKKNIQTWNINKAQVLSGSALVL